MARKDSLDDLLNRGRSPEVRRGKGFTLSTEVQPPQAGQESAQVQKSTSAPVHRQQVIRPSKGFKLRTDIADACKLLAAQKKRKLYEVMEEALIDYLRKNGVEIE